MYRTETLSAAARPTLACYLELTKPKVVLMIVFTAIVGMLLAVEGPAPWAPLLFGTLGIAAAAASGAALNHLIERESDGHMQRTRRRPLPTGSVPASHALALAIGLGFFSVILLATLVNPLTAILSFASLIGYGVVYTVLLKRSTPQNIVWGGAAGAMPPVLGWAAMTGEVHLHAVLLFLIVFTWTPPHFWPLAIHRREDYRRAGIPMLPVTHGVAFTKLQVLLYAVMLLAVSLFPFGAGMSGGLYLAGAVVLGAIFVLQAWRLYRTDDDRQALRVFSYSILYIGLLFALLLVDHYVTPA
ncbi:MAG: heme o synthase [Gammaproteobacteria bacterium]|nr:heme o synthase [Gammaproteobacteria bacterium]